jgi:hypothetical protein
MLPLQHVRFLHKTPVMAWNEQFLSYLDHVVSTNVLKTLIDD